MKITKQQLTAIQQIVMEELYLEAKNQLLMEVGEHQGTEGGNVTGWAAGRQPGDENKKYNKEMEERQPGWNKERGRKADDSHMKPAPAIAESQEHNTLERWSLLAGVKK